MSHAAAAVPLTPPSPPGSGGLRRQVFPLLWSRNVRGRVKLWWAEVHEVEAGGEAVATIFYGDRGGMVMTKEDRYASNRASTSGSGPVPPPFDHAVAEVNAKVARKLEEKGYRPESELPELELEDLFGEPRDAEQEQLDGAVSRFRHGGPPAVRELRRAMAELSLHVLPMLAQTFEPRPRSRNALALPCAVQPKLDGMRCLVYEAAGGSPGAPSLAPFLAPSLAPSLAPPAAPRLVAQTRSGDLLCRADHILASLAGVFSAWREGQARLPPEARRLLVLDGELMAPGVPLRALYRAMWDLRANAPAPGGAGEGEGEAGPQPLPALHVFDLVLLDPRTRLADGTPYRAREALLSSLLPSPLPHVRRVASLAPAASHGDIEARLAECLALGHEGAVLRDPEAPYALGRRTRDMQKYRCLSEEEFRVVGYGRDRAPAEGAVIWLCETNRGGRFTRGRREIFTVVPVGSVEERRRLYDQAEPLIEAGLWLTVTYQEKTSCHVPIHPQGKALRAAAL